MSTLNSFSLYKAKDIMKIVHGMNSPWYMVQIVIGPATAINITI